ncbi:MAG: DUF6370 family protein [Verrucomicrobiales bacterium]|nr:DUF6370 family protein [Verrucomicrobiales bacterium]
MKKSLILSLSVGTLFLLATMTPSYADDKEVTLEGKGECAKCGLKKADSCQNTVTVDKAGKKTTYYIEKNKVAGDFHKNICQEAKDIKVVGTVKEVDGKQVVTATKIEVAKH